MKAVGYTTPGSIDREDALIDVEIDKPHPEGRDILVRIRAVSVNPVDYKIRRNAAPAGDTPKILGWDAAGEVVEIGNEVECFKPGDAVWYAGAIDRPGTNAEFHLVDERIVGRKPNTLNYTEAAALPLTALTSWEMLFDRLRVNDPIPGAGQSILIIGGAGGVGSIAIQLLRSKTNLAIIATASRPETQNWVRELGAHHVLDHTQPLPPQIEALGIGAPGLVFSTTHSGDYAKQIAELIAPQGRFGLIDDPASFDITEFKRKSVSIHWELMFTRSLYQTEDIGQQGHILNQVDELVDAGHIRSTMTQTLGQISAANLKRAHAALESGKTRGKLVLEGY